MSLPSQRKPVALITGAASEIGFELARICSKSMHVVMADNAVTQLCDKVEQLSAESVMEVFGVVCDVTSIDSVKQLAKQTFGHFEQIDLLINNAGIDGRSAPLWELTHEHIRKVMDMNVHGVIHCLQTFLPSLFKQASRCHIINMANIYGLCNGSQMSAFSMSQHALVSLSESLYCDLRRLDKPVDVSVVCQSFATTNSQVHAAPLFTDRFHHMMKALVQRSKTTEELAKHIMEQIKSKSFYIFPDKKVKLYCKERLEAILSQKAPYEHPFVIDVPPFKEIMGSGASFPTL